MLSPVVVGPGKPHQQMQAARPESNSGSRNQRWGQGCAHRAAEGRHRHDEGCRRQQEPYGDSPPHHRQKHAAQYLGEGEGAGGQRRRGSGQTLVDVVGDLVETYPCMHRVSRHTERRQQPERPGPERLTHSKVRLYGSGLWP